MWKEREAARHFFPALRHLHSHWPVNARQCYGGPGTFPSFILTMRIIQKADISLPSTSRSLNMFECQTKPEHVFRFEVQAFAAPSILASSSC
jgi:hypothetical protein